jgi:hypothetical protein
MLATERNTEWIHVKQKYKYQWGINWNDELIVWVLVFDIKERGQWKFQFPVKLCSLVGLPT